MMRKRIQCLVLSSVLMGIGLGFPGTSKGSPPGKALAPVPPGGARIVMGESQMEGTFIHIVFFWLKQGSDKAGMDRLIRECKRYLQPISTVRKFSVGRAAGTPREVVDNSFAVALVIHFDSREGHDAYQTDPKHLEFIKRNRENWERVQVYDVLPE